MHLSAEDSATVDRAIAILSSDLKTADSRPIVLRLSAAAQLMGLSIGSNTVEQFAVLFLDSRHRSLGLEVIATGTVDGVNCYPRAICKRAIELGAKGVVIAHNHPSGDNTPSDSDVTLTDRLAHALEIMDVQLYEHLVIARAPGFPTWAIIRNGPIEA